MCQLLPRLPESDLRELNEDFGLEDNSWVRQPLTSPGVDKVEETQAEQQDLLYSVLLLCGLTDFRKKPYRYEPFWDKWELFFEGQSTHVSQNDILRDFLNCLAELCSFRQGPMQVTALLVEQQDGGDTIFHVTRNAVAKNGLDGGSLTSFLDEILGLIGGIQELKLQQLWKSDEGRKLLDVIIQAHGDRFRFYRRKLGGLIGECASDDKSSPDLDNFRCHFKRFREQFAKKEKTAEDPCAHERRLIHAAYKFFPYLEMYGDKLRSQSYAELYHYTGRLQSYVMYLKSLLRARKAFPELFREGNFAVHFVEPRPSNYVVPELRTAEDLATIVRSRERCSESWDDNNIERLRLNVEAVYDRNCHKGTKYMRCDVHAEVALAHWFWIKTAKRGPAAFLRGFAYVGTSKPCCPLCKDFFAAHPGPMECREAHPNIYPRWTLPALESCDNDVQREELRELYRVMTDKIQSRSGKLLSSDNNFSESRDHDSEDEFMFTSKTRIRQLMKQSQSSSDDSLDDGI